MFPGSVDLASLLGRGWWLVTGWAGPEVVRRWVGGGRGEVGRGGLAR